MIEDVEMTRKILYLYADEEGNNWPSKIEEWDIMQQVPNEEPSKVRAHLQWAYEAGLLDGKPFCHVEAPGVGPIFNHPKGLTKSGSDYVKLARSSLWEKAINYVRSDGLQPTTSALAKVMSQLAANSLSG